MPRVTTDDLIQQVYRKATGELDDSVTSDTEDGRTVLSVINEQIDVYYNSVDQFGARIIWVRNIDPEFVIGEANGSDTVFEIDWDTCQALPDGFYMPIRLRAPSGKEERYDLVPFEQLYDTRHQNQNRCAISSEGLIFASAPQSGEILYPCVVYGSHLTGKEVDVETVSGVHNVLWLSQAAAAEYVRTDIVRGEQYPNVLAQANDTFRRMIADNEARTQALVWEYASPQEPTSMPYDW